MLNTFLRLCVEYYLQILVKKVCTPTRHRHILSVAAAKGRLVGQIKIKLFPLVFYTDLTREKRVGVGGLQREQTTLPPTTTYCQIMRKIINKALLMISTQLNVVHQATTKSVFVYTICLEMKIIFNGQRTKECWEKERDTFWWERHTFFLRKFN